MTVPASVERNERELNSTLPSSNPQRILVVDDEPSVLEGLAMAFESAGREVVPCQTFEDARNRLMSEQFHCVVTDVRLGAFNGLQLAIIARTRNAETRIIVFSGFDDPVLREEASQIGATYLVKPVTAEHLLELVEQC